MLHRNIPTAFPRHRPPDRGSSPVSAETVDFSDITHPGFLPVWISPLVSGLHEVPQLTDFSVPAQVPQSLLVPLLLYPLSLCQLPSVHQSDLSDSSFLLFSHRFPQNLLPRGFLLLTLFLSAISNSATPFRHHPTDWQRICPALPADRYRDLAFPAWNVPSPRHDPHRTGKTGGQFPPESAIFPDKCPLEHTHP